MIIHPTYIPLVLCGINAVEIGLYSNKNEWMNKIETLIILILFCVLIAVIELKCKKLAWVLIIPSILSGIFFSIKLLSPNDDVLLHRKIEKLIKQNLMNKMILKSM